MLIHHQQKFFLSLECGSSKVCMNFMLITFMQKAGTKENAQTGREDEISKEVHGSRRH